MTNIIRIRAILEERFILFMLYFFYKNLTFQLNSEIQGIIIFFFFKFLTTI